MFKIYAHGFWGPVYCSGVRILSLVMAGMKGEGFPQQMFLSSNTSFIHPQITPWYSMTVLLRPFSGEPDISRLSCTIDGMLALE